MSAPMRSHRLLLGLGGVALLIGLLLIVTGLVGGGRRWSTGGGAVAGCGAIWMLCGAWMARDRTRREDVVRGVDRRYLREFLPAMIAYVAVMLLAWPLLPKVHAPALRFVVALLPLCPAALVARALVRRIVGGDELERRVFLEATALAALAVGLGSFALGFLQAAGLLQIRAALLYVLPALFACWGVALAWTRRRYRTDEGARE